MILIENFSQVIAQIESERGIDRHRIIDGIEKALISAAKKKFGAELEVNAYLNEDSGEARLWMEKVVVDSVEDELNELSLSEATELSDDAEIGDTLEIDLDIEDFGRIAAQTAKQVILQCIREAEKDLIMSEFSDKIGQIVTGTVQNIEGNTYLINLGKIEAFLPPKEQVYGENFNVKDRIRVFIVDIQKSNRGPMIRISRSHPGLIQELFKLEVPEIQDGIIEIKSISRDAGRRTKIAVHSTNSSVGAVGTCVGHMGGRIQAILREINNEKIDILEWNEDPKAFIGNSLKPATVSEVIIENEDTREAKVVVPDDQLSLAIGKSGQNVRLAVKLTNWKLDIMSESDHNKLTNPSEGQTLEDKLKETVAEEATAAEAQSEESTEAENNDTIVAENTDETSETATENSPADNTVEPPIASEDAPSDSETTEDDADVTDAPEDVTAEVESVQTES
ncbi:MAG: transcription termination factor NusA [Candidatus Marinamargulisbacteria bacterium]